MASLGCNELINNILDLFGSGNSLLCNKQQAIATWANPDLLPVEIGPIRTDLLKFEYKCNIYFQQNPYKKMPSTNVGHFVQASVC